MRFASRRWFVVFGVVLVALGGAPPGSAQIEGPPSLVSAVPELALTIDGNLTPAGGPNMTAGPCRDLQLAGTDSAPVDQEFTYRPGPGNGTIPYRQASAITIELTYGHRTANNLSAFSGATVDVAAFFGNGTEGRVGNVSVRLRGDNTGPPDSSVHTIPLPASGANVTNGTGAFRILVTITPAPPESPVPAGPGVPVAARNDFAVSCGGPSVVKTFSVALGAPGDLDTDSDGIPDAHDDDDDNDGALDSAEVAKSQGCMFNGAPIDFSKNAPTGKEPDTDDHDGDGVSDVDECAKGSNPLSAHSKPEKPDGPPLARIISGALLIILIALVVLFFTTFGKAVRVDVASGAEQVVAPGAEAAYQVQVTNLKKGGAPINYQLAILGLPDGWDARLSQEHATLDPAGGAANSQTVTLTVEAAEHAEPESAVVKVKAIPLNAAGRKDTFKLPASASTITSINVPPNAKVPVKRGETPKLRSEAEMLQAAAVPAAVPAAEAATKPKRGKPKKEEAAPPAPVAPAKPNVQVGGLSHKPSSFKSGDPVRSSVTVTNGGAVAQTLKLSLFVNDALADAQTVSLKPGKSRDVAFKWTAQERNRLNIRGELVPA